MAIQLYNRTKEPKYVKGSDGKTYEFPPRSRWALPEGVTLVDPLPVGLKQVQSAN